MARGFLKVPVASLLIYDEPTASLDAIAEQYATEMSVALELMSNSRLFEQIFGMARTPEGETVRTTIFCTQCVDLAYSGLR
jgi:alpha-D-ribose 1-methylphosphonate 5-triphosphate synthase subunit PhnL